MSTIATELRATIELQSIAPPAGDVVITNMGSAATRVWELGNQWGDEALSFELSRGDQRGRFVRGDQVYTRNVPSSLLVPAGQSTRLSFDLGDGTWQADPAIESLSGPGVQLEALYEPRDSPEAAELGVWTGQLRSDPVRVDELEGR